MNIDLKKYGFVDVGIENKIYSLPNTPIIVFNLGSTYSFLHKVANAAPMLLIDQIKIETEDELKYLVKNTTRLSWYSSLFSFV
jgi:hypothetical protein